MNVHQYQAFRGDLIKVRTDDGVIGAVHDPWNRDLNGPLEDVEVVLKDDWWDTGDERCTRASTADPNAPGVAIVPFRRRINPLGFVRCFGAPETSLRMKEGGMKRSVMDHEAHCNRRRRTR